MSVGKFDRRVDDGISAHVKRIKEKKEAELFHRRIGWVVFIVVIIALFIWLWCYLGAPPGD